MNASNSWERKMKARQKQEDWRVYQVQEHFKEKEAITKEEDLKDERERHKKKNKKPL